MKSTYSHRMATLGGLAFISGTVGFLTLALFLLVPQMVDQSDPSSILFENLRVTCWCPAQFTSSMLLYTNEMCKNDLLNNNTYKVRTENMLTTEKKQFVNIYENMTMHGSTRSPKKQMIMVTLFELLIIFGFHASNYFAHKDGAISRAVRILGHLIIILFFFLTSVIPYIFLHDNHNSKQISQKSNIFLCDFQVQHQARSHSYVAQCSYSFEISKQNVESHLMLNGIICGVVVILLVGSFISIFTKGKSREEIMQMK